ncbi:SIR2 family protein [Mycoplasma sp. SG1]|uniref:SIR2 family protein n=1 Tax=Mycoplasma sp. SG1 TaxID=2810348 RepID=UPI002024FCA9|nr:SIR2 family protein [Mycoplasma sp. SG1]URM53175.1 SIR2 family protein [Mycoplasma sp. SG1]
MLPEIFNKDHSKIKKTIKNSKYFVDLKLISKKIVENKVILFLGAGFSSNFGLPNLKNLLIIITKDRLYNGTTSQDKKKLQNILDALNQDCLQQPISQILDIILECTDEKERVWLNQLYKKELSLVSHINDNKDYVKSGISLNILPLINQHFNTILTINYDDIFNYDNGKELRLAWKYEENIENIKIPRTNNEKIIVPIHGTIVNDDSHIIDTNRRLTEKWKTDKSFSKNFVNFIKKCIKKEYIFLFIGCSFNDNFLLSEITGFLQAQNISNQEKTLFYVLWDNINKCTKTNTLEVDELKLPPLSKARKNFKFLKLNVFKDTPKIISKQKNIWIFFSLINYLCEQCSLINDINSIKFSEYIFLKNKKDNKNLFNTEKYFNNLISKSSNQSKNFFHKLNKKEIIFIISLFNEKKSLLKIINKDFFNNECYKFMKKFWKFVINNKLDNSEIRNFVSNSKSFIDILNYVINSKSKKLLDNLKKMYHCTNILTVSGNINFRLFFDYYFRKHNNQMEKSWFEDIKIVSKNYQAEKDEDKYNTETFLFILYRLRNFKTKNIDIKKIYYQILTRLLIEYDTKWQLDNYYLLPINILNIHCGKLEFNITKVDIFINKSKLNYSITTKLDIDINKYISFDDFLEINKVIEKIGFGGIDKLFIKYNTINLNDWWNNILIYKIYFYFLQVENQITKEIKDSILNQFPVQQSDFSFSYYFIFIIFAIDLKKENNFKTFQHLFDKLIKQIKKINQKSSNKILEYYYFSKKFIYLLATYLSWYSFEEAIKYIYIHNQQYVNERKYLIKNYLEIFQSVNSKKVSYSYEPFNNILNDVAEKEFNQGLEAVYPRASTIDSDSSVHNLTDYMVINTTEEEFLNYSPKQKILFLNNFLKNNELSPFNFKSLISVINEHKLKDSLFQIKSSQNVSLIIYYFKSIELKNILLSLLIKNDVKDDERREHCSKILDTFQLIFEKDIEIIFFILLYSEIDPISLKLSQFINNLYFNFNNIFIDFYKKLQKMFYNNYLKIWKIFSTNFSFFKNYKFVYFQLITLFISLDDVLNTLDAINYEYIKDNFVKLYFNNIGITWFNEWSFKKTFLKQNRYEIWIKFISFLNWNLSNLIDINSRYMPWFLKQDPELSNNNESIQELFLKLVENKYSKEKNIFDVFNCNKTGGLVGQDYCKINILLSYIIQEHPFEKFLTFIKNNLDFYFSNSIKLTMIIIVLDAFYSTISSVQKQKIKNLLNVMITHCSTNDAPFFTDEEKKGLENNKTYLFSFKQEKKIIRLILDFHFSDINKLCDWEMEKKENIKLLINHCYKNNYWYSLLFKRYDDLKVFRDKIDKFRK